MPSTSVAKVFRLRALELREFETEFLARARGHQKAEWQRRAELLKDAATALEELATVFAVDEAS